VPGGFEPAFEQAKDARLVLNGEDPHGRQCTRRPSG
jgi:hypothetical protein